MSSQCQALPVLITRPEPQASRFIAALKERYDHRVDPVLTPLLAPVFFRPDMRNSLARSIILTSETGARAAALLPGLPKRAFCVGDRTAEVATALGFQAESAAGDSQDLFDLLVNRQDDAPFVHLRGQDTRGDLLARLTSAGVRADEVIVYAQKPVELSQPAITVLMAGGPVIVPLFSPRSAVLFQSALAAQISDKSVLSRLHVIAFSVAVADTFDDFIPDRLSTAAAPRLAELFLAMDRFIFAT